MTIKKWVLTVLFCALTGCESKSADTTDKAAKPVGVMSLEFNDTLRQRPQKVTIWYPAMSSAANARHDYDHFFIGYAQANADFAESPGRHPLLLLSHGDKGNAVNLAWLAEAFVRKGYIVAGVDHWKNTARDFIPEATAKVWERPADLSFVLTQLLADPVWGGRIDAQRVVAAGHSSGGYTVLALAGTHFNHTLMGDYCSGPLRGADCELAKGVDFARIDYSHEGDDSRDPRIRAVYAMAPAVGQGIELDSLRAVAIPVRVVAATNDELLKPALNAERYAQNIPNAELLLLPDGGHFVFMCECTRFGKLISRFIPLDICGLKQAVVRTSIHAQLSADAEQFFNRNLQPSL